MAEISLAPRPDGTIGVTASPNPDATLSAQQPNVADAFNAIPLDKAATAAAAAQASEPATNGERDPLVEFATEMTSAADIETGDANDFDVKPEGTKFLSVIGSAGNELYNLGSIGASNGLLSVSLGSKDKAKESLVDFKDHAIDVCVTLISPSAEGESKLSTLKSQVECKRLVQLPVGLLYTVATLISFVAFCLIHFPAKFTPVILNKCKTKITEWELEQKLLAALALSKQYAGKGVGLVVDKSGELGKAAATNSMVSKIAEVGSSVAGSSAAATVARKFTELRVSTAESLVKLRRRKEETMTEVQGYA